MQQIQVLPTKPASDMQLDSRDVRFAYDPAAQCFRHNLPRDLHLFCIWENARVLERQIIDYLAERFELRAFYEFQWSSTNVRENFGRIYKTLGRGTNRKNEFTGSGPFLCVLIEDKDPTYGYRESSSGPIELANRRLTAAKTEIRSWFDGEFFVHSTSNPQDFLLQAHLLFTPEEMDALGSGRVGASLVTVQRDLVGSCGWRDVGQMFKHLNRTVNYVVLRNFEDLLADGTSKDIDILCDDPDALVAAINGTDVVRTTGVCKCRVEVAGERIPVDVRFVGDGYLDVVWEREILSNSILLDSGIRVPRPDDHFFSLLQHSVLQKPAMSDEYVSTLQRLADAIGLPLQADRELRSAARSIELLCAFLQARNYAWYSPLDRSVYTNRRAAAHIAAVYKVNFQRSRRHLLALNRMVSACARITPDWARSMIPATLLRRVRYARFYMG